MRTSKALGKPARGWQREGKKGERVSKGKGVIEAKEGSGGLNEPSPNIWQASNKVNRSSTLRARKRDKFN